jgi:Mn-dependent DtxR family transcriptional regulator
MSVTRRTVLEQLAVESDAERREATSVEALASALDADEHAVEAHLNGLAACELARIGPDGAVRVTITGEELLELDTDEMVIVDSTTPS